jgi:NTE family protein
MAFGLVMGGGGVVGIAWEIGVVEALAQAGALDAGQAATIVGTSAGSVVGTQLAAGARIDDLVAAQLAPPEAVGGGAAAPDMDAVMKIFGGFAVAEEMTTELATTTGRLAMEAPTGSEDAWVGSFERLLGDAAGKGWPADVDLRVVAMSCTKGERKAWTRADGVPLHRAVASSCAVPGMFPTVEIDGDRYTDGGAWSPSNADLLAGDGLDAVVFIGPIGGFLAGTPQIERELAEVAAAGARTASILPGEAFADLRMQLMNPAFRAQGLEVGRQDGTAAAERVRQALRG